jgi:hypothetical protein
MLQRLRERLALVLIILLPFHAFAVTVLTKLIAGPNNAPLAAIAIWKEILLFFILVLALLELMPRWKKLFQFDAIDWCITLLVVIAIILFALGMPASLGSFIIGFKYDFVPLIAFFILRRVEWSEDFKTLAVMWILLSAGIIALYGIATLFLPMEFFMALGYSDLHSLYVHSGPLAAFQQIESIGIRRMQSVMSGPNQLGLWLLLPWAILCGDVSGSFGFPKAKSQIEGFILLLLIVGGIILSFSRAAWIGAVAILIVATWKTVPRERLKLLVIRYSLFVGVVILGIMIFAPQIILRSVSSTGHLEKPLAAMHMIIGHPFGLGLGTAGPASNAQSDTCVSLETGADVSWAKDRTDLCVFVGDTKIQPLDRECNCPLLPENWYLQIGVELGVLGFITFLMLTFFIIRSSLKNFSFITLTFIGISIAALFLHAWEDSAVAYSVWLLLAAYVPQVTRARTPALQNHK